MAHQIYLTEGIILKKKDFGEADRLFWIYTEKFGMIMASAKGVRVGKSKLRGNLDVFTYGDFAVISSKDFWRLVDAQETISPKLNIKFGWTGKSFYQSGQPAYKNDKRGREKTKNFGTKRRVYFCYFRPRRISLGRKGKPYKRRFERLGNKIHSSYFENLSATWTKSPVSGKA